MSVVKPLQPQSSAAVCTLQGYLLTLAILALLSFTYLLLKSLHTPSLQPSTPTSTAHTVQVSHPQATTTNNDEGFDDAVYHLAEMFKLKYEEMERRFKVYIIPDGDPNTYYQTPRKLTGKYASEGYFFQNLRESKYVTDDPDQADLFFLPISRHKMRGKGISYENTTVIVQNYVETGELGVQVSLLE